MYPSIHINLEKYRQNLNQLYALAKNHGQTVMVVSKVFCADQKLIDVINTTHIEYIADSKIENLKHVKTDKIKVLLRIPQLSQVNEVVMYSDLSLNSELQVIEELNDAAENINKMHQIILMFDIGDLREGIYYKSEYLSIIERILELKHIELTGIGTNLTCFGGVIPTKETLSKLELIKKNIEQHFSISLKMVSGGNSSAIKLLEKGELPQFINNLRIGEAFVLGRETAYGNHIEGMYDDVFTLKAEIVELKEKPSMPEGLLGFDAFGKPANFTDLGKMNRAILGVGRQDVDCENLFDTEDVHILGCSSDHLITQIKNNTYDIGDVLTFKLTYAGILRLMTSPYVRRVYESNI
ncbi:MAG: alanine/ornithine racemase family PLP-dependent enzyme [Firmicutes bacterium]|nr:alanine/ornithine racemase family PLP-dependent enzyme [Bacillota bacterium]